MNTEGLEQWTMQSALAGHPHIVIAAAPGRPVELTVVCQSLTVERDGIDDLAQALEKGDNRDSAEDIWIVARDDFELILTDGDDEVNIHRLDARGLAEKLRAAQEVAGER